MESPTSVRVAFNIIHCSLFHYLTIAVITTHCLLLFFISQEAWYPALETICVVFYVVDTVLHVLFHRPSNFFKFARTAVKAKLQFIVTSLFLFDLGYTLYVYFHPSTSTLSDIAVPFQFLRPAVFILKIKTVNHIFMVVVKTFSRILKTLFIIIMFIVFFSCIAVHVFGEIYENTDDRIYRGQFKHAGLAFIRMFVLITTENYPQVMMPAYEFHHASFTFFMFFIYFGVFILMSILLAIVVDNYWTIAKMNVKRERLRGRKELAVAWNLLADGAGMCYGGCGGWEGQVWYVEEKFVVGAWTFGF